MERLVVVSREIVEALAPLRLKKLHAFPAGRVGRKAEAAKKVGKLLSKFEDWDSAAC